MNNKSVVMSFISKNVKAGDFILLTIEGGVREWRTYTWNYDGANPSFFLEPGEIVKSISWSHPNCVGNHTIRRDYKF